MTEREFLAKARKKAKQKVAFYIHAFVFFIVNLFLFVLNLIVSPDRLWFFWSLLGWGVGFLAHGISVYTNVSDIQENLIQKEMEKIKKQQK